MTVIIALLLLIGLPAIALAILRFADNLLMNRIPQYDPATTKTRTDIYSMRAAYAAFLVGLSVVVLWAVAIAILGVIAGLNILKP